jgi:hypothetical protein
MIVIDGRLRGAAMGLIRIRGHLARGLEEGRYGARPLERNSKLCAQNHPPAEDTAGV